MPQYSEFLYAIRQKNYALFKYLINQLKDINTTCDGLPILLLVVFYSRDLQLINLLLDKNINVNDSPISGKHKGVTPLYYAVQEGYFEIVEKLLENGANQNTVYQHGRNLLWLAVCFNHIDLVKLLIKKEVDINIADTDGMTPLMIAIENGNHAIAKILIDNDADLNIVDVDGRTPLILAIESRNHDIAKMLIAKKADLNIATKDKRTPLMLAIIYKNHKIVKMLINKKPNLNLADSYGKNVLFFAVEADDIYSVRLLVKNKIHLNATDGYGRTALWIASYYKYFNIVKLLIDNDADPHIKDVHGANALNVSAQTGCVDIVKMLLSKGVQPDKADFYGRTPLKCAAKKGHFDIVKIFIEKRVNLNVLDDDGTTPLNVAAEHGHTRVVELLISEGADPNIADFKGETPLWRAAKNGHANIVDILIKNGAIIDASPVAGYYLGVTPLLISINNDHMQAAINLMHNNPEINSIIIDGPYHGETVFSYLIIKLITSDLILNNISEIKGNTLNAVKILIENKLNVVIDNEHILRILQKHIPRLLLEKNNSKCEYTEPNTKDIDLSEIEKIYGKTVVRELQVNNQDAFYSQVDTLMQKYFALSNELKLEPEQSENFETFAKYFRDRTERFPDQMPIFFETMKKQLEEIYLYIYKMSKDNKKEILKDMSRQLVVCGPGIFNSINSYHSEVMQGDLTVEIAKYRSFLVHALFLNVNRQLENESGDDIHLLAFITAMAQKYNYKPLGGAKQLEHGDIFTAYIENNLTIKDINIEQELKDIFDKRYDVSQVVNFIKEQFIIELSENVKFTDGKINMDSSFGEFSRKQMDMISKRYGIDEKQLFIIDDNDYGQFDIESIQNSIFKSLFKFKVAKPQQVVLDGKLLNYISCTDNLYCWDLAGTKVDMSKDIAVKLLKAIANDSIVNKSHVLMHIITFLFNNDMIFDRQNIEYITKLLILNKSSDIAQQKIGYARIAKLISNACADINFEGAMLSMFHEKIRPITELAGDADKKIKSNNDQIRLKSYSI